MLETLQDTTLSRPTAPWQEIRVPSGCSERLRLYNLRFGYAFLWFSTMNQLLLCDVAAARPPLSAAAAAGLCVSGRARVGDNSFAKYTGLTKYEYSSHRGR